MRYKDFKIVETAATDANDPRGPDQRNDPNAGNQTTEITKGPPYENTEQVTELQRELERLGYNVGHTGADGKYGPRTARAVAAFKQDFDVSGDSNSVSTSTVTDMKSAEPKESPTPTNNGGEGSGSGTDSLADIDFASGSESGRVRMRNSGATRNKALNSRLMAVLDKAADEAGVDVVVFSGGQDQRGQGTRRTGSIRHDNGLAADVWIYSDGQRLPTARENPIVSKFIAACVSNGAKGIGAGPGYMSGVGIHVDLWGDRAGATTWGQGGRSRNTPDYVSAAYRAGQTGSYA